MGYIFQPASTVTETFPIALSFMVGIKLRKHGGKTECSGEEGGNLGCGRGKICPAGGTCQRQFAFSNDFGWQRTIKLHIMGKAQCLHSSWQLFTQQRYNHPLLLATKGFSWIKSTLVFDQGKEKRRLRSPTHYCLWDSLLRPSRTFKYKKEIKLLPLQYFSGTVTYAES